MRISALIRCCSALLPAALLAGPPASPDPSARVPVATPGEVDAGLARALDGIAAREREFRAAANGAWAARNTAHGIATKLTPHGVELTVHTSEPAQRVALRLVATERRAARLPIGADAAAKLGARRDRAELHHTAAPIVEWYVNDARGVEQGLDVASDPLPGEGPLRFVFETGGGLSSALKDDGRSVEFRDGDGRVQLQLASLVAFDAAAKPLGARMLLADGRLVYEIDDRGAQYPIVVDPIATAPSFEFVAYPSGSLGFGAAVNTAGDVNGDGFSDFLVNADLTYVFFGSSTGLAPTPGWQAETDSDQTADAVCPAGDVNGDGFDDILIVSESGGSQDGSAHLWLGSADFASRPDGTLANADWRAEPFSLAGVAEGELINCGPPGDLNGDGFSDVVVGWPNYLRNLSVPTAGIVLVWLGNPNMASEPDGTLANADWRATGDEMPLATGFGSAISSGGDVNGDGFDDLIVGAPARRVPPGSEPWGDVLIWLGASSFADDPDGTFANADWTYLEQATVAHTRAGRVVAHAGDVDGDGLSDVLFTRVPANFATGEALLLRGHATTVLDPTPLQVFTLPFWNLDAASAGDANGDGLADVVIGAEVAGNTAGQANLHLGRRGQAPSTTPSATFSGAASSEYFGARVATAGDVNGDGFSDVAAIGTTARVFLGGGSNATPVDDYLFSAVDGAANQGNTPVAGISHGMAGDVDGDGYGDFVVGIGGADEPGLIDAGRFEVAYGGPCGPACGPTHAQGPGSFHGEQAGEGMGWSIAGAGDVNGDGYDDVVVGMPYFDSTEYGFLMADRGRARVYYGSFLGLSPSAFTTLQPSVLAGDLHFGAAVAGAGDVNGDGYADVIIGTPKYGSTGFNEGVIQTFLGSASGINPLILSHSFGIAEARVGAAVSSAGDVNGDGYSDVVFGAPGSARAYVMAGGPAGASNWIWTGQGLAGSEYGQSVGSAGDVNRDGYADILVGQPGYEADGYSRVFLYHGSPTGPSLTPSLTFESPFADRFGSGVASAGDVDGDGYSDAILGAHWYTDSVGFAEGRAAIVYGSPTGLDPARTQPLADCETAPCDYGKDVSGAGDVNGDGFSDVLIGAFSLTNPNFGDGGVFVHFGNGGTGATRQVQQTDLAGNRIGLLGSTGDSGTARVGMRLSSPAGRSRVWLESELERLGTPFDGLGTATSPQFDTGALSVAITNFHGCPLNRACHWRARIRGTNPLFPRSPWFSPPGNGPEQADLRGPVGPDADGDEVADASDNCPTVANPGQQDGSGGLEVPADGVGDACDNCVNANNPRVAASFLTTNPWATLTGGQRDDDHDGYGNKCDAKFVGLPSTNVGGLDLAQFRASNAEDRRFDTCGTTNTRPCAIFDLDEAAAGNSIGGLDLGRFRQLNAATPGPRCAACTGTGSPPLPCTAGTMGTCF